MVKLEGFDELVRELGNMSDAIRAQGMDIIREETEGAAVEIEATYPRKTGTLAKRVTTIYPSTTLLVGIVRSAAPHSHLWEFGTRQRKTASGANRGVMPAHKGQSEKVTPAIASKRRARVVRRLIEMVRGLGFQVEG